MEIQKHLIVLFLLIVASSDLFSQSMVVHKHSFDSLLVKIATGSNERFTQVLSNEYVTLFLYAPRRKDLQQPHNRDEFYIVSKGTGTFWCDGIASKFNEGDLLLAPAGKDHRFISFSDDLVVWVIFYGEKIKAGNKDIVRDYIQSINQHDVSKVMALQTPDHVFKDAIGTELTGRENLEKAWAGYFKLFSDYKIEIESITESDGVVLVFGQAGGSSPNKQFGIWKLPIAIRAEVTGDKISRWQVYADTKIPSDLIRD